MKISYFSEFLVLAETLNYGVAAERLYISIATLSRHIHVLEEQFGTVLFHRSGQGVYLTGAGKILIPYAQTIVNAQAEYHAAVGPIRERPDLCISVATTLPLSFYGITDLITRFQNAQGIDRIDIHRIHSSEIETAMRDKAYDFAIICHIENPPYHLTALPLRKVGFYVLLPTSHRLSARSALQVSDLKSDPLLLFDGSSTFYEQAIQLCSMAGFVPTVRATTHSGRSLEDLVAAGLGIALIPLDTATNLRSGIVRRPIVPSCEVTLDIVYNSTTEFSNCVRALIDYLQSACM